MHLSVFSRCAAAACLLGAAVLLQADAAAATLQVAAAIRPLEYLVARVGGERVRAWSLVPVGVSPEHFEPTPQQLARLADAHMLITFGLAYERRWLAAVRAHRPRIEIVDCRPQAPDGPDPHPWTDPRAAARTAACVREALAARDPQHAPTYAHNLERLRDDLQALDADIRRTLAGAAGCTFLVYHPAWGHFAQAYGLVQLALEHEGKEPGARHLAAVLERARAREVEVLFVQPQMSERLTRTAARALGGRVVTLDPLAYDYLDNMRRVAAAIAAACARP